MPEITESERRWLQDHKAMATENLKSNLMLATGSLEVLLEYIARIESEAESIKRAAEAKEREVAAREAALVANVAAFALVQEDIPEYTKRLENVLHRSTMHPDYQYKTVKGQRKAFDNEPPADDGKGDWTRNTARGNDGWERFEYHEEGYWRRLKPEGYDDEPAEWDID